MRRPKSPHTTTEISGNCIERTCRLRSQPSLPFCGACSTQYCGLFIILLLQIIQSVQGDSNGSHVPDKEKGHSDKVAYVNGFLHVTLYPPTLHATLGKTAVGYVNVSLDESVLNERLWDPTLSTLDAIKTTADDGDDGSLKHIDPGNKAANLHKTKLNQESNGISKVQRDSDSNNLPKTAGRPGDTGGGIAETQLYILTTSNSSKKTSVQDQILQMPSDDEANKNLADTDDQNNFGANLDKVDKLDPYRPDYSRIISSIGITSCCTDDNVASMVTSNGDVTVYNATKSFTVTVEGISLGRTSIKFKVKRNATFSAGSIHKRTAHGESTTEGVTTWWLPYEYKVVVTKSENRARFYLSAVLFGKFSLADPSAPPPPARGPDSFILTYKFFET